MNYTVVWVPRAEAELATVWLNAANRAEVTQAASEAERQMRASPMEIGESRPQDMRILIVPRLGLRFCVFPDDARVQVLSVWRFRRRKQ